MSDQKKIPKTPKAPTPKRAYVPHDPRPQRLQFADENRGAKRRARRGTINWNAPDAHEQWAENVKARANELRGKTS